MGRHGAAPSHVPVACVLGLGVNLFYHLTVERRLSVPLHTAAQGRHRVSTGSAHSQNLVSTGSTQGQHMVGMAEG